jgi:hypothetical protein
MTGAKERNTKIPDRGEFHFYPLDNFSENLGTAGHSIHKRNRTALFVWQNQMSSARAST